MRFNLLSLITGAALAVATAMPAAAIIIDTNSPPRTITCDRQLSAAAFGFSTSTTAGSFGLPFIVEQCLGEARTIGLRGDIGVEYGLEFGGQLFEGTFSDPFQYLTIGLDELGTGFDLSFGFGEPGRAFVGLFSDETLTQINTRSIQSVAAVPLPAGLPLLFGAIAAVVGLRRRSAAT